VQSMTTGGFGDLSAIALARFEDLFTPLEETSATVWSVRITPQARILEIAGPADWQALVSAFPQDVTGTHDGEWRAFSGLAGPWRLPDWAQVMEHYDGVHLTVGAYLACGGLALPAGGGHRMLTGWIRTRPSGCGTSPPATAASAAGMATRRAPEPGTTSKTPSPRTARRLRDRTLIETGP